jgi:aspartate kinase
MIVQKYGGSSLARPEQIQSIAETISKLHASGETLLIVVSAMGKTTDQLISLAYSVSAAPNRRELDMLLTTGERISMALVSMALNDRGIPAISFTGSQAGILTDDLHSSARITDLKPVRVEDGLKRGNVVVIAGFQGVSPKTKEVTTLGRGGSDVTAVAMAAYFKAARCEIRKDVDGVHSADPNVVSQTRHLPRLNFRQLLDMTYWGAKVLHYRSVELATLLKIPLLVGLAHDSGAPHQRETLIDEATPMYEDSRIISVNSHKDVRWIRIHRPDLASAFHEMSRALQLAALPLPQILDSQLVDGKCAFLITSPLETLGAIEQAVKFDASLDFESHELSSVTATCQGAFASPLPEQIAKALGDRSVMIHKMLFGAMSLTVVIEANDRDKTLQIMHEIT